MWIHQRFLRSFIYYNFHYSNSFFQRLLLFWRVQILGSWSCETQFSLAIVSKQFSRKPAHTISEVLQRSLDNRRVNSAPKHTTGSRKAHRQHFQWRKHSSQLQTNCKLHIILCRPYVDSSWVYGAQHLHRVLWASCRRSQMNIIPSSRIYCMMLAL